VETNNDGSFFFQAQSTEDKESWIGCIGKVMVFGSKSKITFQDDDD
jgi:hypothetical protein